MKVIIWWRTLDGRGWVSNFQNFWQYRIHVLNFCVRSTWFCIDLAGVDFLKVNCCRVRYVCVWETVVRKILYKIFCSLLLIAICSSCPIVKHCSHSLNRRSLSSCLRMFVVEFSVGIWLNRGGGEAGVSPASKNFFLFLEQWCQKMINFSQMRVQTGNFQADKPLLCISLRRWKGIVSEQGVEMEFE